MTGIEKHEIERRLEHLEEIARETNRTVENIQRLVHRLLHPRHTTPTTISFQGDNMALVAGTTAVFTGTLTPAGSAYPAGTTFTVTSNYPTVTPAVDVDGLTITVPLPADFVDDPANPLSITYTTSTFVPNPATAPASLTATVTPSIPTLTPTSISFVQTA